MTLVEFIQSVCEEAGVEDLPIVKGGGQTKFGKWIRIVWMFLVPTGRVERWFKGVRYRVHVHYYFEGYCNVRYISFVRRRKMKQYVRLCLKAFGVEKIICVDCWKNKEIYSFDRGINRKKFFAI